MPVVLLEIELKCVRNRICKLLGDFNNACKVIREKIVVTVSLTYKNTLVLHHNVTKYIQVSLIISRRFKKKKIKTKRVLGFRTGKPSALVFY